MNISGELSLTKEYFSFWRKVVFFKARSIVLTKTRNDWLMSRQWEMGKDS